MGYKSNLDVIVEATPSALEKCLSEFHHDQEGKKWAWATIKTIDKTRFTELRMRPGISSQLGDYCWKIEAVDVFGYDSNQTFCLISASPLPGWINELGNILKVNFWPDWNQGKIPESYKEYLTTLLREFKKRGMIQYFPEWMTTSKTEEVFVEDIDCFAAVRDVDPGEVKDLVPISVSEDKIQTFFEDVIGENFHKKDWGGELNDLVTSHITINGNRLRAAFLLKGGGTRGKLTISKCGKNGDQIVRLVEAPVDLYIIQHVDEIDERVVYDLKSKIQLKTSRGERCRMCVIDGTDTARILKAYGKLTDQGPSQVGEGER